MARSLEHQPIARGCNTSFCGRTGALMVDLRSLLIQDPGIMLTELNFIHDRGDIAGNGILPNGDNHEILLVPCDEDHRDNEGCDFETVEKIATAGQIATAGLDSVQVGQAPSALLSVTKVYSSDMIEQIISFSANGMSRAWSI